MKRPTGGQTAVQTMTKQAWLVCRVYYLVTYMWQMSVYIVFTAVFAIFGSAIGLKMFTKNSWGVQVNILHVHMQKSHDALYSYCMHIGFDLSFMLQLPCSCCCKRTSTKVSHAERLSCALLIMGTRTVHLCCVQLTGHTFLGII